MNPQIESMLPRAKSIDEVLDQLDYIIEQSVSDDNYFCAFAYIYRKTTFEVKKLCGFRVPLFQIEQYLSFKYIRLITISYK